MSASTKALKPYVIPRLEVVDLRKRSALAEEELEKVSAFAQPAPPPTSTSNVEGGVVFGSQSEPARQREKKR